MSNSVMIVDDSSTIRRRISDLLSKISGVGDIYEAVDGQMAVDRIKRLTPRIVILDLRMPKMSGLQVLEKILKNGSGPTFIVLTNFPLPNYHDYQKRTRKHFIFLLLIGHSVYTFSFWLTFSKER